MFQSLLLQIGNVLWSTPLLVAVVGAACLVTVGLKGIQFTQFFKGWRLIFAQESSAGNTTGEMTSLQAFFKVLNIGLGNGSLAGVATAIYAGGPGAAFWIFVVGLLVMAIRFAEVFLATSFTSVGKVLAGPFLYLSKVPGGSFLPSVYAVFCLAYSLAGGNAMQCNSITMAVRSMVDVSTVTMGCILALFMVYLFLGGTKRIITLSQYLVPIKVVLFFVTCGGVLLYHFFLIPDALALIFKTAFTGTAVKGAAIGITMQQALRMGLLRVVNATEAGIGTAAVVYGNAAVKSPVESGIVAMIGNFICSNLVCFMVGLTIVVTGVHTSGLNGTALTSAAFQTTFGVFGGWVVAILSLLFGMGVFVSYSYVGMQCWLFLTNNRVPFLFAIIYALDAFMGAVMDISVVWAAVDIVNGCLLILNLYAIVYLLPYMKAALARVMVRA